jgi:hypothetical protein
MTIEQEEDLAKMLTRTVEAFRARRQGSGEKPGRKIKIRIIRR